MDDPAAAKARLRAARRADRARRSVAERTAAGLLLAAAGAPLVHPPGTAAAYAGVGDEPPTRPLLDRWHAAGIRVLLPVVHGAELHWAAYRGWEQLQPGALGLLQPPGPVEPTGALLSAAVVLVPALAVDAAGNRLGRGGGFYDRALAAVDPARTVAVVYDDDVVPVVPVQPHDRLVAAVLSPQRGLMVVAPRR